MDEDAFFNDLLAAVEQQLTAPQTRYVARTYERLIARGMPAEEAKEAIAEALGEETDAMYRRRSGFDEKSYRQRLDELRFPAPPAAEIAPAGTATGVEVRAFTAADAEGMAPLMTDLGYPTTASEVIERISAMPADSHHTLVAELAGKVVGFIGLVTLPVYEHPHPIGWILALSVSSDHRRQGIGKSLVEAAEAFYRQRGIADLRVHSSLQRSEAHEFYQSLGYDRTGYRFRKSIAETD